MAKPEYLERLFPAEVDLTLPPSPTFDSGEPKWWQGVLLFFGVGFLAVLAMFLDSYSSVP